MKQKILIGSIAISMLFGLAGCQNNNSANTPAESKNQTSNSTSSDTAVVTKVQTGVKMVGNVMMVTYDDGSSVAMGSDIGMVMNDGTGVEADGKVTMKDGTVLEMQNGDTLMMDGTLLKAAESSDTLKANSDEVDHLLMKDGKMMTVRGNGEMAVMEKDMVMKDGTKVSTSGKVINMSPSSKSLQMKNGDTMSLDGGLTLGSSQSPRIKAPVINDGAPDSTK